MPDVVLHQYAPGGCFKQLSDAAGGSGIAYSQYAPGGPANQLRAHINPALVLDQHALGGVWAQAETAVEGSGGDAWAAPEGAQIYIDFLADRAWANDGEVAIDTLLGNDPNVDDAWGMPSAYDSGALTADGYDPRGSNVVAFIGAARTKLLAAATVRFVTKQIAGTHPGSVSCAVLGLIAADGNDAVELDAVFNVVNASSNLNVSSWGGSLGSSATGMLAYANGVTNAIAYTVTSTRFEAAGNGFPNLVVGTITSSDRPPGNPLVAALFNYSSGISLIQSITIYDPLSSTDGLVGLSTGGYVGGEEGESGVPGAPTVKPGHGLFTQNVTTSMTYFHHALYNESGPVPWTAITAQLFEDPESDPLVLELVLAADQPFSVGPVGGSGSFVCVDLGSGGISARTLSFILRATDPGGLYAEQQFNVEVVAA